MQSSENGIESTERISESDENILSFLDSMESYISLMDSLSSALRQGWFELAGARQSMGASRVSSALFDLKSHHASTTLQVHGNEGGPDIELPHFTLCKWTSSDDTEKYSGKASLKEDKLLSDKSDSSLLNNSEEEFQDKGTESGGSPVKFDSQAEKERIKSLSVFGKLVSPKLRATQSSFEKALELLVEISNVRSSLLCAHDRVHKDLKSTE